MFANMRTESPNLIGSRTEEPPQDIAARLREIRDHVSVGQQEFAEQLRVPARTYQAYERAESWLSSAILRALAERGFDVNWLLTGSGQMHPKPTKNTGLSDDSPDYDFSHHYPGLCHIEGPDGSDDVRLDLVPEVMASALTASMQNLQAVHTSGDEMQLRNAAGVLISHYKFCFWLWWQERRESKTK